MAAEKSFEAPKSVFGVPWIEIEYGWGDRPEGYQIHRNPKDAVAAAKAGSAKGGYSGGYCGPERPLKVVEIPWEELEKPVQEAIEKGERVVFTRNFWSPKQVLSVTIITD